jgi:predicted ATP-grasp superfamily ATP-dependent carboligase
MKIQLKIKKAKANLSKAAFVAREKVKSILSPKPGLRILFSADYGNEKTIRRCFSLSRHKIKFAAFTRENIRESDLVVPLLIHDVRMLQKSRDLLENNPIKIPKEEVVNLCDNKYLFNTTLVKKGFQDFVPKIGTDLRLPFMLKKKVTWAGDFCYVISDAETKEKYSELINSNDYFCQEIIGGVNEYATHILFKDGKIVKALTVEYTFYDEIPINGKSGFAFTKIVKCNCLDTFAAILNAIGYEGLCCFDYKIEDGKPKIFEINPRFGGSLANYFISFINNLKSAA